MSQGGWYTEEEAQAIFREANEAHLQGDFEAAAAGYRKLLEHGAGGADVHYNLGTTALEMGSLGEAVLHLELARRDGGEDPDVVGNLALARSRQLDALVGDGQPAPFLERLAHATPVPDIGVSFLILWVLGFLLLCARRFSPLRLRTALMVGAVVSLVVAVPLGLLTANRSWVDANVQDAVVMAKVTQVREFPSEKGAVAFEIHEGLEVRMLAREGGYVRIRLANGREGWTRREDVAPVNWTGAERSPTKGG